jgi:hypothetical protein
MRSRRVLRVIEDGAIRWRRVAEEGMADDCNAEIHVSAAREWQKAIKGEQERCRLGYT